MKIFFVYILLLFCRPGLADVIDDFYQFAPPAHAVPHLMIEHGNLEQTNSFHFNPVCAGALQSPALVTNLRSFLKEHAGTRVIERGNDHYLLMQKTESADGETLSKTGSTANVLYAELEFSSATAGAFILRVPPTFFPGTGLGTSSCLAGAFYESSDAAS